MNLQQPPTEPPTEKAFSLDLKHNTLPLSYALP